MTVDTTEFTPLFDIDPLIETLTKQKLVLTANSRLARYIKSAWDHHQLKQGVKHWARAPVYALDDWLLTSWREAVLAGHCASAQLLSSWQEQELWRQIISQSHGGLLQMEQTAALASQARELLIRFDVDINKQKQLFELSPDSGGFYGWLERFDQRLLELGTTTKAMAIQSLANSAQNQTNTHITLVGVHELAPLVSRYFDVTGAQINHVSISSRNQQLLRHAFADKRTELASAAKWAVSHCLDNPGDNIAIVLPDMSTDKPVLEYYLRREFNCLDKNYTSLPVNFSQGFRLAQTPVAQSALDFLSLYCDNLPLERIVSLLQSRFFGVSEADSADTLLGIQQLYRWGATEYDSASVRNALPESALAGVLRKHASAQVLKGDDTLSEWQRKWSEMLDDALWLQGNSLDSMEYQQVQQWYTLLESLAAADGIYGKITYQQALALLKRVARQNDFQPQTPPAKLQVLGLLEAEGLQFDQLWLCDMQADTWPPAARSNPFIPLSLQRELQMPHSSPAREWEFAQAMTKQFIVSNKVVRASYAQLSEGVPALPSALVNEFIDSPVSVASLDEHSWAQALETGVIEYIDDWQAPAVDDEERETLRGGSRILELQAGCERHAFVAYRLGLQPLEPPGAGLSPMVRGIVLHNALYRIWGVLNDRSRLKAMKGPALDELIQSAVSEALTEMPTQGPQANASRWKTIEQSRLECLIAQWLEIEARREPFTVTAREKNETLVLEGLPLRLQIDRIDTLDDQRELIIDYKSGQVSGRSLSGDVLAAPQLPVYLQCVSTVPAGLTFASLKPREMKFTGIGNNAGIDGVTNPPDVDWQEQISRWELQVRELAKSFMAGEASAIGCDQTKCAHPLFCEGGHHE